MSYTGHKKVIIMREKNDKFYPYYKPYLAKDVIRK